MSIPLINEGRLMLVVLIGLSMAAHSFACTGKTMLHIGGLTEYDKQVVLDMHNRMRQEVALGQISGQPPAANMMEMKWDNSLARSAENWAATCYSYTHDQARHTSQYLVGQNIATTWTTRNPSTFYDMKADFGKDAIPKWFNEFKNFRYGGFGQGMTGHYTQTYLDIQSKKHLRVNAYSSISSYITPYARDFHCCGNEMIWANTKSIGCGYAFYYDPAKGYTKNYVCNYGPSGNVYGEKPYEKGYPNCYSYGLVESKKYHGLCDKNSDYLSDFSNYIG